MLCRVISGVAVIPRGGMPDVVRAPHYGVLYRRLVCWVQHLARVEKKVDVPRGDARGSHGNGNSDGNVCNVMDRNVTC